MLLAVCNAFPRSGRAEVRAQAKAAEEATAEAVARADALEASLAEAARLGLEETARAETEESNATQARGGLQHLCLDALRYSREQRW